MKVPVPGYSEMMQAVIDGDVSKARALAEEAVRGGANLVAAIDNGFALGIRRVGDLWEEGEYFLPELVQGAEAMKAAMAVLQPALDTARTGRARVGMVVIGTVRGDFHDIGKSLVATLLAANDFSVHDLGSDVPVEAFVSKARELDADIVAASALLTTTMTVQRDLTRAIEAAGLPRHPQVMVGGAPTTPAWAAEIGAHHAENAVRAVALAREILS